MDGTERPGVGKMVALTFDDGPAPGNDHDILHHLARFNATATFFVIGGKAGAQSSLLQQMAAQGCEVGNHSWSHSPMPSLCAEAQRDELRRTNELLAGAGIRPRWFRPPYGHSDCRTEAIAAAEGLETILWTVDSQDWKGHASDAIARCVIEDLAPGAVILMHSTADSSVMALPGILEHGASRGYRFVTLSEWKRTMSRAAATSIRSAGA